MPSEALAAPRSLSDTQRSRKRWIAALALCLLAASLFTQSLWGADGLHESLEIVGLGLTALCVAGRAWCSLYIGGRKKQGVVTLGPYSVCRNPLYLFSVVGAVSIGFAAGSLTVGVLLGALCFLVFDRLIRREEVYLAAKFGDAYARYAAVTPRWLPRLSLWRDAPELVVQPRLVLITVRDASLFFAALPLFEAIEWLQLEAGSPSSSASPESREFCDRLEVPLECSIYVL
jgi:protein-S-isoprenylcysteine O-methyltransferase Ste14